VGQTAIWLGGCQMSGWDRVLCSVQCRACIDKDSITNQGRSRRTASHVSVLVGDNWPGYVSALHFLLVCSTLAIPTTTHGQPRRLPSPPSLHLCPLSRRHPLRHPPHKTRPRRPPRHQCSPRRAFVQHPQYRTRAHHPTAARGP